MDPEWLGDWPRAPQLTLEQRVALLETQLSEHRERESDLAGDLVGRLTALEQDVDAVKLRTIELRARSSEAFAELTRRLDELKAHMDLLDAGMRAYGGD